MVYYIVPALFLLAFWCPCMAIDISIEYNTVDSMLSPSGNRFKCHEEVLYL